MVFIKTYRVYTALVENCQVDLSSAPQMEFFVFKFPVSPPEYGAVTFRHNTVISSTSHPPEIRIVSIAALDVTIQNSSLRGGNWDCAGNSTLYDGFVGQEISGFNDASQHLTFVNCSFSGSSQPISMTPRGSFSIVSVSDSTFSNFQAVWNINHQSTALFSGLLIRENSQMTWNHPCEGYGPVKRIDMLNSQVVDSSLIFNTCGMILSNVNFRGTSDKISCPPQEKDWPDKGVLRTGFNVSQPNPGLVPAIVDCSLCDTIICPQSTPTPEPTPAPGSFDHVFEVVMAAIGGAAVALIFVLIVVLVRRKRVPTQYLPLKNPGTDDENSLAKLVH